MVSQYPFHDTHSRQLSAHKERMPVRRPRPWVRVAALTVTALALTTWLLTRS
jgi:hypothetical protein